MTYTDDSYQAELHGEPGQHSRHSSCDGTQSTTSAPVGHRREAGGQWPRCRFCGTVNPLIAKPALDLTASAHDVELRNLTPYSLKYAGYPITKGNLNVDLHYKLAITISSNANNHIFIDQLTFGDHVENDTATKLPVRLAIFTAEKPARRNRRESAGVGARWPNLEFAHWWA